MILSNVQKQNEVYNQMYEACESICNECTSKDKFETYKEGIVVEMKEMLIKKDMENKEITREKKHEKSRPQYESEL